MLSEYVEPEGEDVCKKEDKVFYSILLFSFFFFEAFNQHIAIPACHSTNIHYRAYQNGVTGIRTGAKNTSSASIYCNAMFLMRFHFFCAYEIEWFFVCLYECCFCFMLDMLRKNEKKTHFKKIERKKNERTILKALLHIYAQQQGWSGSLCLYCFVWLPFVFFPHLHQCSYKTRWQNKDTKRAYNNDTRVLCIHIHTQQAMKMFAFSIYLNRNS